MKNVHFEKFYLKSHTILYNFTNAGPGERGWVQLNWSALGREGGDGGRCSDLQSLQTGNYGDLGLHGEMHPICISLFVCL